jgi:g-D-glutamyl-meso-diaminopimelate peptidase
MTHRMEEYKVRITVRPGDSLWYYSEIFNIPLSILIDSNPTIIPNLLYLGQEIQVPGYVVENYVVRPGDTLWNIAFESGLHVGSLFLLNPQVNPTQLQIGQMVRIPRRVNWFIVNGRKRYDFTALVQDINQLIEIYPFLKHNIIGNSVMGKDISELRLGKGNKKVHVNGSFHANEWITTPIIMEFLNEYLLALTNNAPIRGREMVPIYEQTDLSLVPMVNPDGVNLVLHGAPEEEPYRSSVFEINVGRTDFSNWKANIRGVDLNNQYPANWEIESARKPQQPAPRDFPGYEPLTEPEAIAVANLTQERNFDRALAYHTQGEVIYWGYLGLEPPESNVLVEEFSRVSGYIPIRYVDSYAGYKDWFIQQWRRPGFTVELGRGVNPLPLDQYDEIYEESLGILLASLYM